MVVNSVVGYRSIVYERGGHRATAAHTSVSELPSSSTPIFRVN